MKKNANYLESSELSSLATLLIDSTAVSLEELKLYLPERYKRYIPHTVMKQIIVHLPIMHVKKSKEQFLVNVHQINFHCTELNKIFETQSEDDWCDLTKQSTDECQKGRSGGRIGIEKIFPSISDVATEFIKSHGFCAQERRRSSTITTSGVSIKEIREHLLKTIPGLKEHGISKQTVRWIFKPVRKDNHAAVHYKGIINAKISKKDNTGREYKGDSHFILSRVKLQREFAEYFKEETAIVSTDNMNKIRYGAPAVSRYHQIRKIYMENDAPQLSDHDFPDLYKTIPCGVMILSNDFEQQDIPIKDHHLLKDKKQVLNIGVLSSTPVHYKKWYQHTTKNGTSTLQKWYNGIIWKMV